MKIKKWLRPALILLIILGGLTGCGGNQTSTSNEPSIGPTNPVQEYADQATETALKGLSENDYDEYIRYCNNQMKSALTREAFEKTSTQMQNQLGNYLSLKYLSTETEGNYVIVHYEASFSKGTFKVRMVFDQNRLIAGQWFE